jgi:hypothetical protein
MPDHLRDAFGKHTISIQTRHVPTPNEVPTAKAYRSKRRQLLLRLREDQ